eukprot:1435187-Amphidinium_carterae.1
MQARIDSSMGFPQKRGCVAGTACVKFSVFLSQAAAEEEPSRDNIIQPEVTLARVLRHALFSCISHSERPQAQQGHMVTTLQLGFACCGDANAVCL